MQAFLGRRTKEPLRMEDKHVIVQNYAEFCLARILLFLERRKITLHLYAMHYIYMHTYFCQVKVLENGGFSIDPFAALQYQASTYYVICPFAENAPESVKI